MKICRAKYKNEVYWGVINSGLISLLNNFENSLPSIEQSQILATVKIEDVEFLALPTPSKIVCVGRNYAAHAKELGNDVPKYPLLFLKAPSAIISGGDSIVIPEQSNQVEHEGELGVVIGRRCMRIPESENSLDYIFGYLCLNDVTARDIQREEVQFTRAKSFDTFCPIGTSIETELDTTDIRISTKVNGVIKQDGRTSQMVFSVPFLVRYISNQMTLNAGDIIATGTPSGVSRLTAGDICEVEIEGLETLKNSVTNIKNL